MRTKRQPNFLYLLAGLLVILVAGPVVYEFTRQPMPLVSQIAFTTTLIVGLWSLMEERKWFIAGIVLVVADISMTALHLMTGTLWTETLTLLIEMTFCVMSLAFAMDHILFGTKMSINRITGAICAYLLLGLILSQANMLIYRFVPGSFNGIDASEISTEGFTLVYYSFVTMTTLGYGDVTPEGALARVLAYLAAIVGQFYIAILVAMLVSQYINQLNESKKAE
ncbi:MAG: potassium channel family protein [Gammaproteobacteria bacterium]